MVADTRMARRISKLGEGIDGIRRVTRETVVTAAALGVSRSPSAVMSTWSSASEAERAETTP